MFYTFSDWNVTTLCSIIFKHSLVFSTSNLIWEIAHSTSTLLAFFENRMNLFLCIPRSHIMHPVHSPFYESKLGLGVNTIKKLFSRQVEKTVEMQTLEACRQTKYLKSKFFGVWFVFSLGTLNLRHVSHKLEYRLGHGV